MKVTLEVEVIHKIDGKVLRLTRCIDDNDKHISETVLDNYQKFDYIIDNNKQTVNETYNSLVEMILNFKWNNLPVSYSINNCGENQKKNIFSAEKILEDYAGYDLYEYQEGKAQVNFYCQDSFSDVLLNSETDLWTTTDYFPAAQPEYYFEGEKPKEVKITFFAQNRECGGIELHEMLHGLGLRNHYGVWMLNEREVCRRDGTIDKESAEKLKALYGL